MITRSSKKRNRIVDIFKSGGIFTAQEISDKLPDIDRATVYRNIKLLKESGVIREISVTNGIGHYEIAHSDHQHAICKNCGKIYHVELDQETIRKIIPNINFEIEDVEIIIKGHCK